VPNYSRVVESIIHDVALLDSEECEESEEIIDYWAGTR
jgi:hypothetical protein